MIKIKEFKYKIGDTIVNKTNWICYIEARLRTEKGANCYLVSNADDADVSELDDEDVAKKGGCWIVKEYEVKRLYD